MEEAKAEWNDVVIKKVDASAYPDKTITLPTGASGLPAIEIYDETGTSTHILLGPDALSVVDIVNAMRDNKLERE